MSTDNYYFNFYPEKWLANDKVLMMTPEERGGYINLLCHAFKMDGLPNNPRVLAGLSGLDEQAFNERSPIMKCFFKKDEKLFNPRMEKEKKRIKKARKQQSDAGKKSAEQRKILAQQAFNERCNGRSNEPSTSKSSSKSISIKEFNTLLEQYEMVYTRWSSHVYLTNHSGSHKKKPFVEDCKKGIKKVMGYGHTIEDILTAIDNYAEAVAKNNAYKWTLVKFLNQANGCKEYVHGNKMATFDSGGDKRDYSHLNREGDG